MSKLFEPYRSGVLDLKNRMVMAPLTRRRAENEFLAPNDLMAEYYAQRATAGLIVSEASQVTPQGYGYLNSPGCYTEHQFRGWENITRRVHQEGGKIFLQLWHVGALSHPLLQPGKSLPLSASDVNTEGSVLTPEGHKDYVKPRPMTLDEIEETVKAYGHAAAMARKSGFDGVEIHGAHGYLPDQFLRDGTNKRTDRYGGSIENRARFLFEILDAVCRAWDPQHTGIRLSPGFSRTNFTESDPEKTYGYVVERLNDYDLAYLHLSEFGPAGFRDDKAKNNLLPHYRKLFRGTLISCGAYDRSSAIRTVEEGLADLIAFGKSYIANPDLVERLQQGAQLNEPDKSTFYHGGVRGYTDYPFLKDKK